MGYPLRCIGNPRVANSNRRSKPQVYRVKPVINSYSQAGTAPFETRIEQAPVIVVGTADNKGFSILVDSLSGQRCEVICVEHHGQLYDHVLEQATLVFVLVSGFSVQLLNAETEALIRRAPHISVIPVVEYAEQERATALLEGYLSQLDVGAAFLQVSGYELSMQTSQKVYTRVAAISLFDLM